MLRIFFSSEVVLEPINQRLDLAELFLMEKEPSWFDLNRIKIKKMMIPLCIPFGE